MESIILNGGLVLLALFLVLINGLFVAAEFALVKVRATKIDSYIAQNRMFAKTVRVQLRQLDASLSACQLGITLASLGLGWIGEPALAKILRPILISIGVTSNVVLHSVAFALAFSIITVLHITIGEQVPKMYAVTHPERVSLWCAFPLKFFYVITYPFLIVLNSSSNYILRLVGIDASGEHSETHSEEEIRGLLAQAHSHGELSRTEHKLLDAVFEFDDRVASEIMIPKREVVFLEAGKTLKEYLQIMSSAKHTRYPYCKKSLDDVMGVVHIKDLLGIDETQDFDLSSVLRPPLKIPEGLEVGKLLRHFQGTKQHMAFVVDEFGNVIGAVTLENVLEVIVGAVQDEFDQEQPRIVSEENNSFRVDGSISVSELSKTLKVAIDNVEAETLSGAVTESLGDLPKVGDKVTLGEISTEVLETQNGRATQIRVKLLTE